MPPTIGITRTRCELSGERDDFPSNRHPAPSFCLSVISGQTRCVCPEGKPVPTFPDHTPGLRCLILGSAAPCPLPTSPGIRLPPTTGEDLWVILIGRRLLDASPRAEAEPTTFQDV